MVIRLKVPIEMHYTVIPMGTSKVNSSQALNCKKTYAVFMLLTFILIIIILTLGR